MESPSESTRFSLRVARWQPTSPDEQVDPSEFDVVIVRRPATWSARWVDLTSYVGYVAIHADSLVYWEWMVPETNLERAEMVVDRPLGEELGRLVREVFAGYQNHYGANPLLDAADALEGYVEWAEATVARNGCYQALLGVDGEPIGLAVVDWTSDPPDIQLAGMLPNARGRGQYAILLAGLMARAASGGHGRIQISTQVHNAAVQRVWAGLGWKPIDAFDTTHLVRAALLGVDPPVGGIRA